ncbi:oxidoreductase [Cladochytrium replicatum]|nr:oxidoreductase [Cladochytrium replicatum]
MSNMRVLIVGASIAGPTAAYWFSKAGATVTIIERFPALRTNGQGVDIRTAGVNVMRRMPGMEEAVRSKSTSVQGFGFVDENGKAVATFKPTGDPDKQSLVSEYEIFRGDLAQILYDMTKDDEKIKYVFDEQVVAIHQRGDDADGAVTVEFANGYPTQEYELVVACDGSTSRTRAIGLGCGVREYMVPNGSWAVYFTIEGDMLEGSKIAQAYSAPGGRFVAIGPDPAGVTRVTMMGIFDKSNCDAMVPFREALKEGKDTLKKYVYEHFHGAKWKTGEILEAMMKTDDFYGSEVVQVKPPTLYKGRFVLVGDAGYAPGPTGSGTTLAMAGAYLLAGEICKHGIEVQAGLREYEKKMRPIMEELQRVPPMVPGIFAPQTEFGLWFRNQAFMFIEWSRILEFADKLFGGAFGRTDDEKFMLPEYEWARK